MKHSITPHDNYGIRTYLCAKGFYLEKILLPSPLEKVSWPIAKRHDVEVWIKRDDLIHQHISGNKWRKLMYNVKRMKTLKLKGILTFGGAFSNHIAATAYAGNQFGFSTIGIIRGTYVDVSNSTLGFAVKKGMEVIPVSIDDYKRKDSQEYLEDLAAKYPGYLIVPEGGANLDGVRGCAEILRENEMEFDEIYCPVGTATTFTGLIAGSSNETKVTGIAALKGAGYLKDNVNNFLTAIDETKEHDHSFTQNKNWILELDFHFGGFAKINVQLVRFMNAFYRRTGIPLDPVYTAKMMWAIKYFIIQGRIKAGSKIMVLHTGGLQGIKGMNERLKNKGYRIEYGDKI